MRQCNECANRECHLIHAPRPEYVVNKMTGEEVLKPMELRVKHRVPVEEMQKYCLKYKPIHRKGSTILEHAIYNSPEAVRDLLDRMHMTIIDVSYAPYFRVVPIRKPRRFKRGRRKAA